MHDKHPMFFFLISRSFKQTHIQSTALRHLIHLCAFQYLHLCCHYLLAEAIICLEHGASSVYLLFVCPCCVLNLNCCMPCYAANHCPAIAYCTLMYSFPLSNILLQQHCFSAVPSIIPSLCSWDLHLHPIII